MCQANTKLELLAVAVYMDSASGTPLSQRYGESGTPSSGRVGTPASGSWRTPAGSAGKDPEIRRVGNVDFSACPAPEPLVPTASASRDASIAPLACHSSIPFEQEDVRVSQSRSSSETAPGAACKKATETSIPETLPAAEGWFDELYVEEGVTKVNCNAGSTDGGDEVQEDAPELETVMTGVEPVCKTTVKVTTVEETEPDGIEECPSNKTSGSQVPERCATRRQAALCNTLCPSPAVSGATPTGTCLPGRAKKGTAGRGRVAVGAARTEKASNMKSLTQVGLQEKFRAPGVVSVAGKGQGRGGKLAKRKRDLNSE